MIYGIYLVYLINSILYRTLYPVTSSHGCFVTAIFVWRTGQWLRGRGMVADLCYFASPKLTIVYQSLLWYGPGFSIWHIYWTLYHVPGSIYRVLLGQLSPLPAILSTAIVSSHIISKVTKWPSDEVTDDLLLQTLELGPSTWMYVVIVYSEITKCIISDGQTWYSTSH